MGGRTSLIDDGDGVGANIPPNQELCPRCHRPRWYTLKKLAVLLLIIGLLMALIKYSVEYGDRTLSLWFG
jgi:hypothetical protein